MYFVILEPGNRYVMFLGHPNDAAFVARKLHGYIVGEGRTREEAWADSRPLRID